MSGSRFQLPVTLVTGFLGAGKTTLLNRILAQGEERVAVVVNEFGDLAIDGSLIVGADDDVIELSNGCVCCSVRGDLRDAVAGLLKRRRRWLAPLRFDRILIETSGLASPGPVLQTFLIEGELAAQTVVDGVVTVVHAQHIERQLDENPEASDQVGYADRVLLNHVDQCSAEALDVAERAVRAVNGVASIVRTERAQTALAPLLGVGGTEPSRWELAQAGSHDHSVAHTHGVRTVALRSTDPLDLHRLKMWLQFIATRRAWDVMRIKGIVRCVDHNPPVIVQGVYQWLELGPGEGTAPDESVLVFIGRHIDETELQRGWDNVLGRSPGVT